MGDKIIFGLIGLFLGGIGGFFVGGAVCAKEYKKTIEALQMENETLVEESEKAISDREKAVRKAEVKYRVEDIIKKEGYSSPENDEKENGGNSYTFYSDEIAEFDDPFDSEVNDKKPKGFRILTEDQYSEDIKYVESESLTYYQRDKVLADAFGDPITNATNIVGADALKSAETTKENYIYVSDDDEEKLYEIEIDHEESFYRDVAK